MSPTGGHFSVLVDDGGSQVWEVGWGREFLWEGPGLHCGNPSGKVQAGRSRSGVTGCGGPQRGRAGRGLRRSPGLLVLFLHLKGTT